MCNILETCSIIKVDNEIIGQISFYHSGSSVILIAESKYEHESNYTQLMLSNATIGQPIIITVPHAVILRKKH